MSALAIGGIVFLCLVFAALIGMFLHDRLPDHHLSSDSKDAIKLATAVVGTVSALVLGFLIASAKTTFDDAETELRTSVAQLVLLDRVMARYGPETGEARQVLARLVEARLRQDWSRGSDGESTDNRTGDDSGIERVQEMLRALVPGTDPQRLLQSRAIEVSGKVAEAHWMFVETGSETLPEAFLAILVFWLALLFFTFGLLSPTNGTVTFTLIVCALSVAGAVFLIIDMVHPYTGLIYLSKEPLRTALEQLGRP